MASHLRDTELFCKVLLLFFTGYFHFLHKSLFSTPKPPHPFHIQATEQHISLFKNSNAICKRLQNSTELTTEINWYVFKSSNTTLFLVVCIATLGHNYMFRPSNLAIFRLYMRNVSICYTNRSGDFIGSVGGR